MDFLVGGVPRGGTTVAAKFLSLQQDMFCYAGETHIVPLLQELFGQHACAPGKIDACTQFLRSQLMSSMVAMPRFSVSRGAHPANLIFDEQAVEQVLDAVRSSLKRGKFGEALLGDALGLLRDLLAERDPRPIRGEKTPSNVFALAEHGPGHPVISVVVMRDPIGVVRSMRARQDKYAEPFSGDIENCIGIYLEYGSACLRCLKQPDSVLVRYEEMAEDPGEVLRRMYARFDREPEERVIRFVEHGGDKEIADRAPMNYKRLTLSPKTDGLTPLDVWKTVELTRCVREAVGYTDAYLAGIGYPIPDECPEVDVPVMLTPLGGFHQKEPNSYAWMKKEGRLIVYMPKTKKAIVRLVFWSNFPDLVTGGKSVSLTLYVSGSQRQQVEVKGKRGAAVIEAVLFANDLSPMGTTGCYAILELRSSMVYAPIAALDGTNDTRTVSFVLTSWSVQT